MAEDDVNKALEKFDKELDTYIAIKEKLEKNFNIGKEAKTTADRDFQLQTLKVQLTSDFFPSVISVIMSILVAIITVIITLSIGFSDVVPDYFTIYLIGYPIAVTIATSIGSWYIFNSLRNKRLKEIKDKFISNVDTQNS